MALRLGLTRGTLGKSKVCAGSLQGAPLGMGVWRPSGWRQVRVSRPRGSVFSLRTLRGCWVLHPLQLRTALAALRVKVGRAGSSEAARVNQAENDDAGGARGDGLAADHAAGAACLRHLAVGVLPR